MNRADSFGSTAIGTLVSLCTVLKQFCILVELPLAPVMLFRFSQSAAGAGLCMGISVFVIDPLAPCMSECINIAVNISVSAYLADMSGISRLSAGSFFNRNIKIAVCALEIMAS